MNEFDNNYSFHYFLEIVEICVIWCTSIDLVNNMNGKRQMEEMDPKLSQMAALTNWIDNEYGCKFLVRN